MLDLYQLQTFRVVALTNSFNRAAAALGYSQSSVTFHIQSLERELGATLFTRHRLSRGATLTEAGRRALAFADQLLALAQEAKAAIGGDSANA
jgi:DNA-binding transcriptional LysR family regulator